MNKLMKTIGLASALTLVSMNVMAGDHHNKYEHHNYDRYEHHDYERYERAKVVDVDPIYKYVHVRSPERECWSEPRRDGHNQSYTSTIAGGIIGGVIGNQFGGGSGKTVMTVAGTLLGGSVGRDLGQNNYQETRYEERCHVTDRHHEERVLDGYNVTYRYHGKLYSTYMDHDPGKFISVDVNVKPHDYSYRERDYY